MGTIKIGENMEVKEEIIEKAFSIAMKAHKHPEKQYLSEKVRSSSFDIVYFSFPGSWSVNDWFSRSPFGEVEVDLQLFRSLKYIGLDERAKLNEAFLQRFRAVLDNRQFKDEVGKAVAGGKQVVFTGHSSGGPIAILSTIWLLENYIRSDTGKVAPLEPLCVTFGSPLVGDFIVNHALRRENWAQFLHFVMRYDIVPRISLASLSSIEQQLQRILNYLNPKPSLYKQDNAFEAVGFYKTVMKNSLSVASFAACKSMGSTNPLLDTLSSFVDLSPYRPFGTYVFCTGNRKCFVTSNTDAVLQLLFYSSQLNSADEEIMVAQRSLKDHWDYKEELQLQNITYLDRHYLEVLPLSSDGENGQSENINSALNDLGVSARGRLCLRAAEENEKQKWRNQSTMDKKKKDIREQLEKLEGYKRNCEVRKVGYYDAFKISNEKHDFHANVARLELAGIWDEIIEMLKRHELPDRFEGLKEWIDLGTRYRRVVEPLDIANYYRHLKNEDTGPYMVKGRPKRYKGTQRWLEHALRMPSELAGSCFWAEVEELCINTGKPGNRESVLNLMKKVPKWIQEGELGEDVNLENSTFMRLQRDHFLRNMDQGLAFRSS